METYEIRLLFFFVSVIGIVWLINLIINLLVRIIKEARAWFQFVITFGLILFLIFIYHAPEETGKVIGLIIKLIRLILEGLIALVESILDSSSIANTMHSYI